MLKYTQSYIEIATIFEEYKRLIYDEKQAAWQVNSFDKTINREQMLYSGKSFIRAILCFLK